MRVSDARITRGEWVNLKPIPKDEFLAWAATRGIGMDNHGTMAYLDHEGVCRFWRYPEYCDDYHEFFVAVIRSFAPAPPVFLWPESQTWDFRVPQDLPEGIRPEFLDSIPGLKGNALEMGIADGIETIRMMTHVAVVGCTRWDDLYILPEDGSAICYLEHHDVVWITAPDEAGIEAIVKKMAAAGYNLPTELPDETFKPVAWMKPKAADPEQ